MLLLPFVNTGPAVTLQEVPPALVSSWLKRVWGDTSAYSSTVCGGNVTLICCKVAVASQSQQPPDVPGGSLPPLLAFPAWLVRLQQSATQDLPQALVPPPQLFSVCQMEQSLPTLQVGLRQSPGAALKCALAQCPPSATVSPNRTHTYSMC